MAKAKTVKINGQKFKDGDLVTVVFQAKVVVRERTNYGGGPGTPNVSLTSVELDGESVEAWPEADFVDASDKVKDREFRSVGVTLVKR